MEMFKYGKTKSMKESIKSMILTGSITPFAIAFVSNIHLQHSGKNLRHTYDQTDGHDANKIILHIQPKPKRKVLQQQVPFVSGRRYKDIVVEVNDWSHTVGRFAGRVHDLDLDPDSVVGLRGVPVGLLEGLHVGRAARPVHELASR